MVRRAPSLDPSRKRSGPFGIWNTAVGLPMGKAGGVEHAGTICITERHVTSTSTHNNGGFVP